jgi:hypothetical protein
VQCLISLEFDAPAATRPCIAARVQGLNDMKIATRIVLLFFAFIPLNSVAQVQKSNIVVIMTDDQTLESLRVMQKTRTLIARSPCC